jgi:hypothetical protein
MKGYLIDMDGVVYRGKGIIPGAQEFINSLVLNQVPFTFFTNNSQRTRRDTAYKMNRLGFNITEKQISTCAMTAARYLKRRNPNGSAYVIGEGGPLHALHCNGYGAKTWPDTPISRMKSSAALPGSALRKSGRPDKNKKPAPEIPERVFILHAEIRNDDHRRRHRRRRRNCAAGDVLHAGGLR